VKGEIWGVVAPPRPKILKFLSACYNPGEYTRFAKVSMMSVKNEKSL